MPLTREILIWPALLLAMAVPVVLAAFSPLLAWRDPVYILGGFAGVVALALMLLQPLAVGGRLPGLGGLRGRQLHHWIGAAVTVAVIVHVGALWLTSPPDIIDALLFRSPTPFAIWGVIAMWALFASALLALRRRRLGLRLWRRVHTALVCLIVPGSILHALLITGTMEPWSKVVLCALIAAATRRTIVARRAWAGRGNQG